jgi:hypothetical protein
MTDEAIAGTAIADESDAAEQERIAKYNEEQQRLAEFNAHPHTLLNGILKDLRAPSALDANGRLNTLQHAVSRLVQVIIQHTPPLPEKPNG